MAANITITRVTTGTGSGASIGPELFRSSRGVELVKMAGAATAVDDTGTYNVQSFTPDSNTFIIGGGFDITAVSGQQVTVRTKYALGSATAYVWIAQAV